MATLNTWGKCLYGVLIGFWISAFMFTAFRSADRATGPASVAATKEVEVTVNRNGLTPENAIQGSNAFRPVDSISFSRPITGNQFWKPSFEDGKRCFVSLYHSGNKPMFVTLPEDFCEGLR